MNGADNYMRKIVCTVQAKKALVITIAVITTFFLNGCTVPYYENSIRNSQNETVHIPVKQNDSIGQNYINDDFTEQNSDKTGDDEDKQNGSTIHDDTEEKTNQVNISNVYKDSNSLNNQNQNSQNNGINKGSQNNISMNDNKNEFKTYMYLKSTGEVVRINTPVIEFHDINYVNNIPRQSFKHYTIARNEITIDNSYFKMVIPKNTVYRKDIENHILTYMKLVEQASGFTFYPENKNFPKVEIVIGTSSNMDIIEINANNLIIDEPSSPYILARQMSFTLYLRNSGPKNIRSFYESFAILNGYRVLKLNNMNTVKIPNEYVYFSEIAHALKDLENYYFNAGNFSADVGYRFAVYLEEIYGETVLTDIIKKWAELYGDALDSQSKEKFAEIIKIVTSEDVFQNFKKWYIKNSEKFEFIPLTDPAGAGEGVSEVLVMPLFSNFNISYSNPEISNFTKNEKNFIESYIKNDKNFIESYINKYGNFIASYSDYKYIKDYKFVFDFTEGFALIQHYNFDVKGIFGYFYSEGNNTLRFYDSSGKIIFSEDVNNELVYLEINGAVKIEVLGDKGLISLQPDFNAMAMRKES